MPAGPSPADVSLEVAKPNSKGRFHGKILAEQHWDKKGRYSATSQVKQLTFNWLLVRPFATLNRPQSIELYNYYVFRLARKCRSSTLTWMLYFLTLCSLFSELYFSQRKRPSACHPLQVHTAENVFRPFSSAQWGTYKAAFKREHGLYTQQC